MSISDETLMAYADGELEPAQRAEVEAAMAADPKVAERVERHRALRRKLNAAFDPVLLETVPHALIAAPAVSRRRIIGRQARGARQRRSRAAPSGGATVTDLRRVRAARAAEAKEAAASARRGGETPRRRGRGSSGARWPRASPLGAVIAYLVMKAPEASRIGTEHGQLVAQTDLAQALSTAARHRSIDGCARADRRELQIESRRHLPHIHREGRERAGRPRLPRGRRVARAGAGECAARHERARWL